GKNSTSQVPGFAEPRLTQEAYGPRAAGAGTAMDPPFLAGIEFVHALGQVVQRDKVAVQIADVVLVRLAHIKDKQIFPGVETLLQFFHADFRNTDVHRLLLSSQSAELFVVDEFSHSGMVAANDAVWVLAQLELAEFHAQRVHQQQPPDERLAAPENELDNLRGLNQADQTGQNAQNSTLGAGRHQAGRRRFRIEAAIAGTILRGKNAGLTFKAEDRAINVGLAAKDTGVVYQETRREIVCAVNDDVEVGEDLQRI